MSATTAVGEIVVNGNEGSVHTGNNNTASASAKNAYKSFDGTATYETSQKYYNETWSSTYDADMLGSVSFGGARALARVVDEVVNKLGMPMSLRILDVGCGTGILGEELRTRGFNNIDGLDPSRAMLDKAQEKNVYGKLYESFVSVDTAVPDIEPETYDVVTSCGSFAHAHIPPLAIRQLLRLVKRNQGLVAICYRPVPMFDGERKYLEEMAAVQQALIDEGQVEIVQDERVEQYANYNGWRVGRAVVYRRLK